MALLQALQQLQPEQTRDFWQQLQKQSGATKKEYDANSIADLVASCQLPYINRVLN
jgi:hypothetical protein